MLLELYLSFVKIGLLSIGGGYAAIPLIQNEIVKLQGWITLQEFMDLVTIAEMTPGPIAINAATFVGMKVMGVYGALSATLGCITPSLVIVLLLAMVYSKYGNMDFLQAILKNLRPAVIALILAAGLSMLLRAVTDQPGNFWSLDFFSIFVFLLTIVGLRKYRMNPITLMLLMACLSVIAHFAFKI